METTVNTTFAVTSLNSGNITNACTFKRLDGSEITIFPGQVLENLSDFSLPVLSDTSMIDGENCIPFESPNNAIAFAFAAVQDRGILSALGRTAEHFKTEVEEELHISLQQIAPGQNVKLTLVEDEGANGQDNIIWVLGDIDDSL